MSALTLSGASPRVASVAMVLTASLLAPALLAAAVLRWDPEQYLRVGLPSGRLAPGLLFALLAALSALLAARLRSRLRAALCALALGAAGWVLLEGLAYGWGGWLLRGSLRALGPTALLWLSLLQLAALGGASARPSSLAAALEAPSRLLARCGAALTLGASLGALQLWNTGARPWVLCAWGSGLALGLLGARAFRALSREALALGSGARVDAVEGARTHTLLFGGGEAELLALPVPEGGAYREQRAADVLRVPRGLASALRRRSAARAAWLLLGVASLGGAALAARRFPLPFSPEAGRDEDSNPLLWREYTERRVPGLALWQLPRGARGGFLQLLGVDGTGRVFRHAELLRALRAQPPAWLARVAGAERECLGAPTGEGFPEAYRSPHVEEQVLLFGCQRLFITDIAEEGNAAYRLNLATGSIRPAPPPGASSEVSRDEPPPTFLRPHRLSRQRARDPLEGL